MIDSAYLLVTVAIVAATGLVYALLAYGEQRRTRRDEATEAPPTADAGVPRLRRPHVRPAHGRVVPTPAPDPERER